MAFPEEIYRGADGYETMRLATYDLSSQQWVDWFEQRDDVEAAYSERPDGTYVWLHVSWSDNDDSATFTVAEDTLQPSGWQETFKEFDSVDDALVYHDELAKDVLDRIDLMESHEVQVLAGGAL